MPHGPSERVQPIAIAPREANTPTPFVVPSIAINGKTFSYRKPATTTTTTTATTTLTAAAGPTELHARLKYKPGKWDIWMLGVTIVIGGQYFSWNAGVAAGLYSYMVACVLIATAYITLCCCTSEINGALPFAGGAYGLARCTLGFYPAFIIGCCEALEYISYVSTSVVSLTDMIVAVEPRAGSVKPLIWAGFYLSALFFHLRGDRTFWLFNLTLGSVSLAIVVVYVIGSLSHVDYAKHAMDPSLQFVQGFGGFMKALPLGCWFFVGVEALSLASDHVPQPKQNIPFAQIACVCTLLGTAIMVLFVTVSLPPGLAALPHELVPFNNGFTLMFGISPTNATILSLPATYATAFGFVWCYGKLIAAMATSKLLPSFLARTSKGSSTPSTALIFGSIISYVACLVVYFVPSVSDCLFNVSITAAFLSYTGQCIGYISLKINYRNIKSSHFHNPFGIVGALYSMSVWLLCLVSIAGFQGNSGVEIAIFGLIVAVLTVYYYAWARKRQTFSAAENRILLVAHVMKFNGRRTAAGRKNVSSGGSKGNKSTQQQHHCTGAYDANSGKPEGAGKRTGKCSGR